MNSSIELIFGPNQAIHKESNLPNDKISREPNEIINNDISNLLDSKIDFELKESNSPIDIFVYWKDRVPDFPNWVTIQKSYQFLPVVQVTTTEDKVSELADLRHVEKITEVSQGSANVLISNNQLDPYMGNYPLFLNETYEMVNIENSTIDMGNEVVIAILSTGINETHPTLDDQDDNLFTEDPKIIDSYNAAGEVGTEDTIGRGTSLASIVAGTSGTGGRFSTSIDSISQFPYLDPGFVYNSQILNGIIPVGSNNYGLAPQASLFDVKIVDDTGDYSEATAVEGIEWSIEHGADIILLDVMNFPSTAITIINAIEIASQYGTLVVVPAGDYDKPNFYDDGEIAPYYTINSPASAPSALTVGAITETESLWFSSERGPVPVTEISKPDVVAPGVNVLGANNDFLEREEQNQWEELYYDIYTGTAIAAGVVAGISARLIQTFPGASPNAIKIALRQSAKDLGYNEMAQGKGLPDYSEAYNILQTASNLSDNELFNQKFNQNYDPTQLLYADFVDTKILIDGSYTDDTIVNPVWHDWRDQENGNFSTMSAPWNPTFSSNNNGSYWYNITFPGAQNVRFTITNRTIMENGTIRIYASNDPNDPGSTPFWTRTTNSSATDIRTPSAPVNSLFINYNITGFPNNWMTTSPIEPLQGYISIRYHASGTRAGADDEFEFDDLVTNTLKNDLEATVEYWYPASAKDTPTSTILSYYDIYVLPQPRAGTYFTNFGMNTASDYYRNLSTVLNEYLDAGGNILFIGDEDYFEYNFATNIFGVNWHYGGVGGYTTDLINHELTTYPFELNELLINAPLTYFSGIGQPVVYDGNVPTVVYHAPVGKGKAVFVADEDVFNDEEWENPFDPALTGLNNNSQFALNIFYWLNDVTFQSGFPNLNQELIELIKYDVPKLVTAGDTWTLETTLHNGGNYTTEALVALGLNWTSSNLIVLGEDADGNPSSGIFSAQIDDNANDTWHLSPDQDIATSVNDTSIEFYYNISDQYPVHQIAFPYIQMETSGVNRSAGTSVISINDIILEPIYQTASGITYHSIYPTGTFFQYNNKIKITVPFEDNITLVSFAIYGYFYEHENDASVQHFTTGSLAPGQEYQLNIDITTELTHLPYEISPEIRIIPLNLTHALEEPDVGSETIYEISVQYGDSIGGHYLLQNLPLYVIPKAERSGSLPILYDITPGDITSKSSPKIVSFPGDFRVDRLTIISSIPINNDENSKFSLELSGDITTLAVLGNFSEAPFGIGSYQSNVIAPDYFINNKLFYSSHLLLDSFNTTIEPVLQTFIPQNTNPDTYTGKLSLLLNNTPIYELDISLTIKTPLASFLLWDYYDNAETEGDSITNNRNYDKLWDQIFEVWKIASDAGYDIDSIYQEKHLYEQRINEDISYYDWLDFYIGSSIPCEEDITQHYSGILGVAIDFSVSSYVTNFLERGGSLIQFGLNHLGPTFAGEVTYQTSSVLSVIDSDTSNNPLMNGVDQLFYVGGGYVQVNRDTDERKLKYDTISGIDWYNGVNRSRDLAFIHHDPIIPERYGYDAGKYPNNIILGGLDDQDYLGMKIMVGTHVLAQSWFIENLDAWAYFNTRYAADQSWIQDNIAFNINNNKFIENIFLTASNQAPEIESVSISPKHFRIGDFVNVNIKVSDDQTPVNELTVLIPERFETGFLFINMSYNSSTGEFTANIPIIDRDVVNKLPQWNFAVMDSFYRTIWADESVIGGCKPNIIPILNEKPLAFVAYDLWMVDNSLLLNDDVKVGDLITLLINYEDAEDGSSILCNVSLIHYLHSNLTEVIMYQLFSGTGLATFHTDTTSLETGTYMIRAIVTDLDGGQDAFDLVGFNIGEGTMLKPPPGGGGGINVGSIAVGGVLLTGIIASAGGGAFFFFRRRGVE
ncbi:MAG: S8 family peptidase [Candidatus Hodarchaeales archaeon]